MGGPLSGVTVVALEQAVSAPMCTRTLGDFGARVIKVENPEGGDFARHYDDVVGGLAAHFVWVNRGKESVALDLKSPAGSAVLHRLLDRADVLVSNLTPGTTAKLGFSPADLEVSHPGLIAVYRTADGQTVVLGTTNDREWQRLARELLDRPDLADDERFRTNARRVEHRSVLDAEIAAWCARHDLAYVQARADAAGIGNARYNTQRDVLAHPQLAARARWRQIDTPAGPVPALLPPPVIAGHEPPMGAVPALGEHTDAVLAELGFPAEEIADLREQGAVR
ncbi:CaiB/BaiF CoA transferase family protein [Streptomyces sp. MCAF7]